MSDATALASAAGSETGFVFAGPVECLVFRFPDGADLGEGLRALLDAVDRGAVDLLDIECVRLDPDAGPVSFPITELTGPEGATLAIFDGADSELLDDDDLRQLGAELEPGGFALVIVYEDRTLLPVARAWHAVGGIELLTGGVDLNALDHVLETGE